MCLEKALAQARESGEKDLVLQALYSVGDASAAVPSLCRSSW